MLLTALLEPVAGWLRRAGAPPALAAGVATFALLAGLAALALVVYSRSVAQLAQLPPVLTLAVDEVRRWLITGPLELDPAQVSELRNAVVGYVEQAAPTPMASELTALRSLGALVLGVVGALVAVPLLALLYRAAAALRDDAGQHRQVTADR